MSAGPFLYHVIEECKIDLPVGSVKQLFSKLSSWTFKYGCLVCLKIKKTFKITVSSRYATLIASIFSHTHNFALFTLRAKTRIGRIFILLDIQNIAPMIFLARYVNP